MSPSPPTESVTPPLYQQCPQRRKVTSQRSTRRAEQLIAQAEADLAITVLESKLPPGFRSVTLAPSAALPAGAANQPHRRAADLLKEGAAGKVPLISLPPHEMLPRLFQKEMARRKIVWRTAMEISSQDLVSVYVRNGLGAGLAVRTPELQRESGLRLLPLSGFPSLTIGAVLARTARRDCAGVRRRTGGEGEADFWQASRGSGLMSDGMRMNAPHFVRLK